MAIETRKDEAMPFLVREVAALIPLAELLNLVQMSTKAGIVPSFSLDGDELVTDSRLFANLVHQY